MFAYNIQTFKYTDVTEDVLPLTAFTYDVISEENFDCAVEYQVSHDSVADGQVEYHYFFVYIFVVFVFTFLFGGFVQGY